MSSAVLKNLVWNMDGYSSTETKCRIILQTQVEIQVISDFVFSVERLYKDRTLKENTLSKQVCQTLVSTKIST
jgi:hypothetical protein